MCEQIAIQRIDRGIVEIGRQYAFPQVVENNATANVPGTFVYTPPVGTVLQAGNGQTLSVVFTPTNAAGYGNGTASVLINVIASQDSATLVTTRTLSRDVNNDVIVNITIANTGSNPATAVRITSAKIGTAVGTPLPQALPNIPAGGSVGAVVRFAAASVGAPSSAAVFSLSGTYSGGSFGGSSRVTLP